MKRKTVAKDRRRFLAGAGKYGALIVGAAYMPGVTTLEAAVQGRGGQARAPEPEPDAAEKPLEEKNAIRIMGVTQRKPGLTKAEAFGADSPHIVPSYYSTVYKALTQKTPGRSTGSIINTVTDSAFGGDRKGPPGPYNLHVTVAPEQTPCTSLVNRDMVCEVSFDPTPPTGGRGGGAGGWAPNQPRWVENGTEMNLAMQQVLAHGTRPYPIADTPKAMYFLKMASSVAAANHLKAWQTLHDRAVQTVAGFAEGLQGFEVLLRLPDVAPKQSMKCAGEVVLPDLVAAYWPKDGVRNFTDYARAFRMADKEQVLDLPASFFLLVTEFDAVIGGG